MSELEAFKSHINLTEYAASAGYVIDRQASSRNSVAMRHDNGDKIVIARGADNHWIYFSVRDATDNGTIIDFVQRRKHCKLGGVRQALRPWIGISATALQRPPTHRFVETIETITKDRARVLLELARMKDCAFHRYLEDERGIPAALLSSPRFAGKVKIDMRKNAVFPHQDQDGPCGYEMKNRNFTGFSKGGDKGLWFSAAKKGDETLVIAESAIDALSYAVLHPSEKTRYASIGGTMNPNQPALIRAAIHKMPEGATLIIATDNDPEGRKLADRIEVLARETVSNDLVITRDLPERAGADWNDVLKDSAASLPIRAPFG